MKFALPVAVTSLLALFAASLADNVIIPLEKATGFYPIFSQADIQAKSDFEAAVAQFSDGCEIRQGMLLVAEDLAFCHLHGDCEETRARAEKLEDEANALIHGAIAERKRIKQRAGLSTTKSLLLGTYYATNRTWLCIDYSMDYTMEFGGSQQDEAT